MIYVKVEALPAKPGEHYLHNYEEQSASFDWSEVEKEFSWSKTGKINMAHEAIDRHAESDRKNKVALYYKDQHRHETYTFYEMKRMTNRAANLLKAHSDLEKGDRIFIFMPRSPELYFLMFGALKMGLIVGPLFEAFMEGAIYDRLDDSDAKSIITTPELLPRIPKDRLPNLKTIFLVGEEGAEETEGHIDVLKHLHSCSDKFDVEWLDKEDGLVLHYTSGSTGKPKGVLHAQYAMVQQYQTGKWVLDFQEQDIYWCTADPGWVTGVLAVAERRDHGHSRRPLFSGCLVSSDRRFRRYGLVQCTDSIPHADGRRGCIGERIRSVDIAPRAVCR